MDPTTLRTYINSARARRDQARQYKSTYYQSAQTYKQQYDDAIAQVNQYREEEREAQRELDAYEQQAAQAEQEAEAARQEARA